MKILFLHKWLVMGGIERVLINYLNLLKDEPNLTIELLIAFDTPDNVFSSCIPDNIKVTYLFDKNYFQQRKIIYLNRKNNPINRIKDKFLKLKEKCYCKQRIKSYIQENKIDLIINFSNHFDPYIPFHLVPTIRWIHLSLSDIPSKALKKETLYLKQYNKLVAICHEMAKEITALTNIDQNHIFVLYNPINQKEILEKASADCLLPEKPYFVQVARLDRIKRHNLLLEIYAELVKQGIEEDLYILGNGSEFEALTQKIQQLSLENRCFLLGEIKNPYPYIKNATLFLHTSEREGLPTVLLESLILDTPVIAISCKTGVKEILNNGKAGILISEDNISEFIPAVKDLLSNEENLKLLKTNMKENLIIFSEKEIKDKFINMINLIK